MPEKLFKMTIERAYEAQQFPLCWINEFGTYTVIAIRWVKFYGYELELLEPLAGHEPETHFANVGDDIELFYLISWPDKPKSILNPLLPCWYVLKGCVLIVWEYSLRDDWQAFVAYLRLLYEVGKGD